MHLEATAEEWVYQAPASVALGAVTRSTLSDIPWVPLGKAVLPPGSPTCLLYLPRAARSPAAPPPPCPPRRSPGPHPRPPRWLPAALGAPRASLPARGPAAPAPHPGARGLHRPARLSPSCSLCGGTCRFSRGPLWRSSEPFSPPSPPSPSSPCPERRGPERRPCSRPLVRLWGTVMNLGGGRAGVGPGRVWPRGGFAPGDEGQLLLRRVVDWV